MCHAKRTTTILYRLINSDDEVSYIYSLEHEVTESAKSPEEYGSYQEEDSKDISEGGHNVSDIDTGEMQYYMKKLEQQGPAIKISVSPAKFKPSSKSVIVQTKPEERLKISTTRRIRRNPYTLVYSKSRSTKTGTPASKMKRSKAARKTTELCCTTAHVRRKRWAADTYEDIEKLTTLDSLEKELLFSGKYAPWQRKLYALRKKWVMNASDFGTTRKKIIGKQRMKRLLRRRGGVIHEPGYRLKKRLNLTSDEGGWNDTLYFNGTFNWNLIRTEPASSFEISLSEQDVQPEKPEEDEQPTTASTENESIFHL